MKVLVIGDLHFRLELPYSSALEDGRRGEWGAALAAITSASKQADVVVLMGDNLNTRHNNSTVIREFVEFLKTFGNKHVHILVGNHERYGTSSALDFLERLDHDKWHVYTSPAQKIDVGGVRMTFVPFMIPWMADGVGDHKEDTKAFMSTLEEADVAFFHQGITGAKTHGSMVDLFNEMVFSKEELEKKFKKIFSGHIHQHQKLSEKTQMTGSVFSMEVGEQTKNVYLYDTETGGTEEIRLPVRGIYGIEDGEYSRTDIPENSIVKCTITDRAIDIEDVKKTLSKYDAHVLVEHYPSERRKLEAGDAKMDLDIPSLLKVYAKARNIEYNMLMEGMDLLKQS